MVREAVLTIPDVEPEGGGHPIPPLMLVMAWYMGSMAESSPVMPAEITFHAGEAGVLSHPARPRRRRTLVEAVDQLK
jgi:hypothetical protein